MGFFAAFESAIYVEERETPNNVLWRPLKAQGPRKEKPKGKRDEKGNKSWMQI